LNKRRINTFITQEAIREYYKKELKEYLEREFEDYVYGELAYKIS
jgi:hypothetical protein